MQAIGNVNALPALIGDVIYEPSDCYFRYPLSPKPFAQHNQVVVASADTQQREHRQNVTKGEQDGAGGKLREFAGSETRRSPGRSR